MCLPGLAPGNTQGLPSLRGMPRSTAMAGSPKCTTLEPVLESGNRSSPVSQVDVVPTQAHDLTAPAAGQHQQANGGNRRQRGEALPLRVT